MHVAPFWHGLLAHSSTSRSQFPSNDSNKLHRASDAGTQALAQGTRPPAPRSSQFDWSRVSMRVHSNEYSEMKLYSQTPFANPGAQVHRYESSETETTSDESVQAASFAHGPLAHSSTSTLQLPASAHNLPETTQCCPHGTKPGPRKAQPCASTLSATEHSSAYSSITE